MPRELRFPGFFGGLGSRATQRPHSDSAATPLPHDGVLGSAVAFLQEALRWWDHG